MTRTRTRRHENGLIAVEQGMVNGWNLTYNPDDERWYVSDDPSGINAKDYAERRNAVAYAKSHYPVRAAE